MPYSSWLLPDGVIIEAGGLVICDYCPCIIPGSESSTSGSGSLPSSSMASVSSQSASSSVQNIGDDCPDCSYFGWLTPLTIQVDLSGLSATSPANPTFYDCVDSTPVYAWKVTSANLGEYTLTQCPECPCDWVYEGNGELSIGIYSQNPSWPYAWDVLENTLSGNLLIKVHIYGTQDDPGRVTIKVGVSAVVTWPCDTPREVILPLCGSTLDTAEGTCESYSNTVPTYETSLNYFDGGDRCDEAGNCGTFSYLGRYEKLTGDMVVSWTVNQ